MAEVSKILERINSEAPGLLEALDKLAPTDLQSLLLFVFHRRAGSMRPSDLLAEHGRRGLAAPCTIDQRLLHQFDAAALEAEEGFEAVELSPLCPLGTVNLLAGIHQNNVLSAVRNAELLSDPTTGQALECARRRRKLRSERRSSVPVKLCGCHRVVRMQPFDKPWFRPHFRLFSLCTAGRDTGSDSFETTALYEHIRVYLKLFEGLERRRFQFRDIEVEISDTEIIGRMIERLQMDRNEIRREVRAHLPEASEQLLEKHGISLPKSIDDPEAELSDLASDFPVRPAITRLARVKERVIRRLADEFPGVVFCLDMSRLQGLGYYSGLCMKVDAKDAEGVRIGLADGGFTNWTQVLLSDRKERLLTSGIGSELACARYIKD